MNKKRIVFCCGLFITAVALATIYLCNKVIDDYAKGKLYADTKLIPFNRVGILLGTSEYLSNGRGNPYFSFRVEAAKQLIKAGKIKYLVISGDNSHADYDEPTAMRASLISGGIDSSIIYLDYAGFRTFDSMVRLKDIFDQDTVTIISQQFHNERAIYTAKKLGIVAIGFNAEDVNSSQGFTTNAREKLARVKTFLDFWFDKKAKFSGPKIIIPA